jgi:hypothetical protein
MKNYLVCLLLFVVFVSSESISAQKKSKNDWLKSGDTLVYDVINQKKQYNFIVRHLQIENNIAFDWNMTSPNEMAGSLVISRYALDTATMQKNYFQDGESVLTDKTCVWVSKKVYNAMKKKKPVTINSGNGMAVLEYKGKEDYTFKLNGVEHTVKVIYGVTKKAEKYWILDDPKNPIILKMDLGWTVKLMDVKM